MSTVAWHARVFVWHRPPRIRSHAYITYEQLDTSTARLVLRQSRASNSPCLIVFLPISWVWERERERERMPSRIVSASASLNKKRRGGKGGVSSGERQSARGRTMIESGHFSVLPNVSSAVEMLYTSAVVSHGRPPSA